LYNNQKKKCGKIGGFFVSPPNKIPPPGGGGGTQKSFIWGGSGPRSSPLSFYIPFFSEKVPLSYTFYWKKAPLSYTSLRRLMNKSLKQEVFLPFFVIWKCLFPMHLFNYNMNKNLNKNLNLSNTVRFFQGWLQSDSR